MLDISTLPMVYTPTSNWGNWKPTWYCYAKSLGSEHRSPKTLPWMMPISNRWRRGRWYTMEKTHGIPWYTMIYWPLYFHQKDIPVDGGSWKRCFLTMWRTLCPKFFLFSLKGQHRLSEAPWWRWIWSSISFKKRHSDSFIYWESVWCCVCIHIYIWYIIIYIYINILLCYMYIYIYICTYARSITHLRNLRVSKSKKWKEVQQCDSDLCPTSLRDG